MFNNAITPRTAGCLGAGCVAAFLLACIGLVLPFDIALNLAFGWGVYLWRVVPLTTVNMMGMATAAVCLVLLGLSTHSFLVWVCRSSGRTWKPRWTTSLLAMVILMFVAGIAATGVTHQVGWLLSSKERWVDGSGMMQPMRRSQSTNNLKQFGLGLHNYHAKYLAFPPGGEFTRDGRGFHGWQTRLLPYMEVGELYNRINFDIPWNDAAQRTVFQTKLSTYLNPGYPSASLVDGYGASHYSGNVHLLGGDVPKTFADIKDGTAQTILAGEVAGQFKPWGYPTNWRDPADGVNRSPRGFGGPYKGGANFLMADGSVKFLKDTIDPKVLKALSTPAGGESVSPNLD